jgi:hypothetical protein
VGQFSAQAPQEMQSSLILYAIVVSSKYVFAHGRRAKRLWAYSLLYHKLIFLQGVNGKFPVKTLEKDVNNL